MHHTTTIKSGYHYAALCHVVGCAFLAFACAITQSTRPGVVANNTFSPSRPPASRYGEDRSWTCPTTEAFQIVMRELRSPSTLVLKEAIPATLGSALYSSPPPLAKPPPGYSDSPTDKPIPEPDGRLCAV